MPPNEQPKYFSLKEDRDQANGGVAMNLGSIDSKDTSEFNSAVNTINNKNNRKLKKI